MAEMTDYPAGSFCWVDLATTDPQAAKNFYGALFGWTAEDIAEETGMPYSILSYEGKQVCACYRMGPEQGEHPYWASFIRVDSVDDTVALAQSLGASLVVPPMDVMDHGRLGFIQDPSGAVIGLWQARSHFGAEIDNQVGARNWSELLTRDTAAASAFYGALFGWTTRTSPDLMGGRYVLFELAGKPLAGMLEIEDSWGPMPPHWAVYFGVADCDLVVEMAKQTGGKALMETMEIPRVGRFTYLADPQGASFAVIQRSLGSAD